MATVEYHLASPMPVRLRFDDEDGQAITDMAFQVRVMTGAACVTIAGALDGEDFAFDLSGLTLTPRLYPMSIYSNDGAGWSFNATINLNVIGGC